MSELAQMAGRYSGSAKGEANGAQEAEVQAKKRVCAEAVMLGLFFYFLPKVWAKGERVGKDFFFEKGEQQRAVYEMYRRAGLTVVHRPASPSQMILRPLVAWPRSPVCWPQTKNNGALNYWHPF